MLDDAGSPRSVLRGRGAIKLSLAMGVAAALVFVPALRITNGYWAALTVGFIQGGPAAGGSFARSRSRPVRPGVVANVVNIHIHTPLTGHNRRLFYFRPCL